MLRCLFVLIFVLIPMSSFAVGPMRAVIAANEGAFPTTPVISATPGSTTNTITLTSGDVGALTNILYWDTTSRASYDLYANNISNATLVAASFPGTPYVHTGRTNGTPYYYRLCGTDLAGQTCSSEVSGTPAAGGSSINDDFSTDTSANYVSAYGANSALVVSGGHATSSGDIYQQRWVNHTTQLSSANHTVSGLIGLTADGSISRLILRCSGGNGSSGYIITPSGSAIIISSFTDAAETYVGEWSYAWTTGTYHTVSISVNSSNQFTLTVDGTSVGTAITSATYTTGRYVGLGWSQNGTAVYVDNFAGTSP